MKVPTPVQETDELDPFRGSVVSDEEAALESPVQTQLDGEGSKKKKKEVYIYPSSGGDGHRRLGSAGTGTRIGEEDRMMTSAEMNMKSQFLMNLRPFGQESARTETDREGMSSEEEGAGEEEEQEEEQLGPGSDFFR